MRVRAVSGDAASRMPPSSLEKWGVGSGERWCAERCLCGVRSACVGLASDEEGEAMSGITELQNWSKLRQVRVRVTNVHCS